MPIRTSIRIDTREAERLFRRKRWTQGDWRSVAIRIHNYQENAADSMYARLRRGGTHRGVYWADFAPQGTRADGTVIPAHGGIPKVRGEGLRLGRLRPSGARVSASSALLQDTGNLRGRALSSRRITRNAVTMSSPIKYARHQHKHRPWAFFYLPDDLTTHQRILLNHWKRK